jgi:hypothetical protein
MRHRAFWPSEVNEIFCTFKLGAGVNANVKLTR